MICNVYLLLHKIGGVIPYIERWIDKMCGTYYDCDLPCILFCCCICNGYLVIDLTKFSNCRCNNLIVINGCTLRKYTCSFILVKRNVWVLSCWTCSRRTKTKGISNRVGLKYKFILNLLCIRRVLSIWCYGKVLATNIAVGLKRATSTLLQKGPYVSYTV